MAFSRYEGAPEQNQIRMPENDLDASVQNMTISEIIGRFERFCSGTEGLDMYPWATRFVMGFPLPAWQRPPVWTEEQNIRFIQSIWMGVDIGSYMINDVYEFVKNTGNPNGIATFRENSEILLDGQQRLSAIEAYLTNRFAVPDASGTPRYWKDLSKFERRRFGSMHFARATIRTWDENKLRKAYDLRAFGGTAHTEDQRACR